MKYLITALDLVMLWVCGVIVMSIFAGELKFPTAAQVMNSAAILALLGVNASVSRK